MFSWSFLGGSLMVSLDVLYLKKTYIELLNVLNFPYLAVIFREGNGTPLQYSCLENPMDGGAWWAAVHGVAKSQTWMSDFTFTFHFHALEKEMATRSSVLAWRIPGTGEPWAAIYGVTQSWTRLKRLSSSSSCYIRDAYLSGFLIKIAFFFSFLFCMAPSALDPGLRRRLPPFLNFLNSFYQQLFPRKTPIAFQSFLLSFRRWSMLRTGTSGPPGNLLCHISPQMLMLCSFTAQFMAVLS